MFKLKPYINMNIKLRKKAKNNFEKDFLKLMNECSFYDVSKNNAEDAEAKINTSNFELDRPVPKGKIKK